MFMLQKIANTIRHLTMDAVELAGSGHPGMPMGCAELGVILPSGLAPLFKTSVGAVSLEESIIEVETVQSE